MKKRMHLKRNTIRSNLNILSKQRHPSNSLRWNRAILTPRQAPTQLLSHSEHHEESRWFSRMVTVNAYSDYSLLIPSWEGKNLNENTPLQTTKLLEGDYNLFGLAAPYLFWDLSSNNKTQSEIGQTLFFLQNWGIHTGLAPHAGPHRHCEVTRELSA